MGWLCNNDGFATVWRACPWGMTVPGVVSQKFAATITVGVCVPPVTWSVMLSAKLPPVVLTDAEHAMLREWTRR